MVGQPFAAYAGPDPYVFVSYSHEDSGVVYPELERLRASGFNIWYDEGIAPGSSWRDEVANAIAGAATFVFFVTARSLRSENCVREVSFALDRRVPVLPVYLEPAELPPGLQLALGHRQAINRFEQAASSYEEKLEASIRRLMAGTDDAPAPSVDVPARRRVWLVAALVVVLVAAAGLNRFAPSTFLEGRDSPASVAPASIDDRSVAVMRFARIGGDLAFSDGLSERLLHLLARVRELSVPSRTSSWALSDLDLEAPDIAQRLSVRFVLEGSVQQNDDQIRVTAQLIDAAADKHVWSESYDRTLDAKNFFAIQDDIARQVAERLEITLSSASNAVLAKVPTVRTDALHQYLSGREFLRRPASNEALDGAVNAFNAAIALDPAYAEAHAGLCEADLAWYAFTQDAARFAEAETACLEALALDDSLGEVFAALGSLHRYAGRLDESILELRKAAELLPHTASVLEELGRAYQSANEIERARAAFDDAIRVEPGNWSVYKSKGNFLFRIGRPAEAIPYYELTLTLDPENVVARTNLPVALTMVGRFDDAIAAWQGFIDEDPPYIALMGYANALYYQGNYVDSAAMLKRALDKNPKDHRAWRNLADSLRHVPGEAEAARDAYLEVIELARANLKVNVESSETLSSLAVAYARTGQTELAREMLQRLDEVGWEDPAAAFLVGVTRLVLGDRQGALDAVERAVANGFSPPLIAAEPDFAALKGEGRFAAITQSATYQGDRHE